MVYIIQLSCLCRNLAGTVTFLSIPLPFSNFDEYEEPHLFILFTKDPATFFDGACREVSFTHLHFSYFH
jgi:hypothetical protein